MVSPRVSRIGGKLGVIGYEKGESTVFMWLKSD